jgi:type I restriction enzyme R subunit
VRDIVRALVDAVDPDTQAKAIEGAADPDAARRELLERAIAPVAASPELRTRILELRATHDRVIDEVNTDVLLDAHGVVDAGRARSVVESWAQYLLDHRDEITAIQLATDAKERRIAFADIQELADRISRPPYNWTPDIIWHAYEAIDVDRVRHSDRATLTDLVSLLRYTVGVDNELVPYAAKVRERYTAWLAQQGQAGTAFSPVERWWLDRMVDVIASSAGITADDLDRAPFAEKGGVDGALRDLGDRAGDVLDELNTELTA